jgi:hypothetical protein
MTFPCTESGDVGTTGLRALPSQLILFKLVIAGFELQLPILSDPELHINIRISDFSENWELRTRFSDT